MQQRVFRTIIAIALAVLALGVSLFVLSQDDNVAIAASGDLIQRVYTDKARYDPGDTVTVTVEVDNQTGSSWNGTLYLYIDHLETEVYSATQSLNVSSGVTTTKTFTWTVSSTDFRGYHVEVKAGTTDQNATAIDVSSDWTRYPRYGYIYDYPSSESAAQSAAKVDELAENYHLNAVQLYDWMWKHETFVKRTNGSIDSTWTDLFGRTIAWQTIQNQISAAHDQNMAAMAYAMVYGAREGYEQNSGVNPQWGMYQNTSHQNQLNVDFGGGTYLWMFNPANPNWQNYILSEYQDAIQTADFDGIHVDQMGQRADPYDYWDNTIDLDYSFSSFINNAKEHLNAVAAHTSGKAGQDALTFNIVDGTVDGWAVDDVTNNANTDFDYSEIWWLSDTYDDMYDYIRQVRENNGGKALVLAAYMNYKAGENDLYEAEDATLYNVGTNNNHSGYTGSGFVDGYGDLGDYVQFSVDAPHDGDYVLAFRYANDTGGTVTRSLYVGGVDQTQLQFYDQSAWNDWAFDAQYVATLAAGSNAIKLARDASDSGYINLDSLTVYPDTSLRYEAEDATLNNVGTNTDHLDYTGDGFEDGYGDAGDYVQFSISVPEAGTYALVFRYANDTGGDCTRSIYVDSTDEAQVSFHDQDDWDTWINDAYHVTELTAGNHTIKLARDAGDSGFINLDNLTLGTFSEASVRLADAAFAASGATHLELGEGGQMLPHEYYPNRAKQMRSGLQAAMKDHYDFITAYENLLFDADVAYGDGGTQWLSISGESISGDGSGDTIWYTLRRDDDYDILHLVNLLDNDDQWRNEATTPTVKSDLSVKYYIGPDASVSGVYVASPDIDHGATESLSYSTSSDSSGSYVSFTVPTLKYWDVIYIERSFSAPSGDRYEAESAVKTDVGTNTNHTGYTGSGFVDGFASQGDMVSFYIYAATEDDYYLKFRYANDTGSTATRDVYVDGAYRGRVSMADLANWDTWGDGMLTTHLSQGLHHVVFYYGSGNSTAINLDHLDVKPAYVWTFDTEIDRLPEGYYLTLRAGLPGYVHWGTDNWNDVTDTWFVPNGSSDSDADYEITLGPFSGDTEVNFTFKWDDDDDGTADRWEGEDWSIGTNAPTGDYYQVEGISGNNYAFAQFDAHGALFDFMVPLGIWSGIKVDGSVGSQGAQVNINKSVAGVKIGSDYYWLDDADSWAYSQSYVSDTTTINTVITHTSEPIKITAYAFVPKDITYPTDTSSNDIHGLLVQRFTVENTGGSSKELSFIYFQDMNINGDNAQDSVSYQSSEDALFFHDPGDSGSGRTRTMDFGLVLTTTTGATSGYKVYQISDAGYLSKTFTLSASGSRSIDALLVGATVDSVNQNLYNSTIKEAITWFNTANVGSLRSTTESYWTDLLDDATTFESPDETYNSIFKRSILASYLYFDAEHGAMGAGSYNGAYFYCWPRDAVYGAVTLDKVGLHDVAENVYDWLWNTAKRDTSSNDYGSDGKYYRFWYQKYTMDGEPEWWNPQIDETAIIPWGAWYHYQQTGDSQFLTDYDDLVKEAGLVSSEDNDHPGMDYSESEKLMFSMNLWEDKWGMFLYTNANVYAGLRDGSSFMTAAGDSSTASTFDSRATNIYSGVTDLYSSTVGYYVHALDVKQSYDGSAIVDTDVSADVSTLGLVTPFQIEPVTKTEIISTLLEVEEALTDLSETKMAYGGVTRYRADQEERYGSDYRDLGDSYYDGGPWMMPTNWMSEYYLEWADELTGTTKIDTAQDYLDYVISYLGNLGLGAEQIDENKSSDEFALETAWANIWESNGKIVDNMMAFIDYQYDAPNDSITVAPKLPSDWNYLGSHIQINDGDLYVKVTKGTNQRTVDLDNNSTNNLTVNVYVQTDASPTSVTGTSLSWSYDSDTGRVRLYGTLNASESDDITISF
jgi:GH15 family glucan-1,4-alpha-glucosidase